MAHQAPPPRRRTPQPGRTLPAPSQLGRYQAQGQTGRTGGPRLQVLYPQHRGHCPGPVGPARFQPAGSVGQGPGRGRG
eukprot:1926747-Alexandrium_andersonii.AAC.1